MPTIEFQKAQWIRAVDIWLLGPLMIYAATKPNVPEWAKIALGIAGGLTILYNAQNYVLNARIPTLPKLPAS